MDASEFKEFIFGLLFIKRLSDEFYRKRVHLRNHPTRLSVVRAYETEGGEI